MVDINNVANYKPCKKKQFEVWMCRPPLGTVVVDHLTQTRGSKVLKQYGISANLITADDIRAWKAKNDQRFAVVMQAVQGGFVSMVSNASQVVLCGTEGQFYIADYNFVRAQYAVFSNGGYVGLDAVPELRDKLFDWWRVRANQDYASKTMACFVPKSQSFAFGSWVVNEPGIAHGKGDFIVCARLSDGKPDFSNRWVVNGLIFSDTYNNTGWTDCIQIGMQGVIDMPPSVIVKQEEDKSLVGVLNKLFYIPSIKKSSQGNQYWFEAHNFKIIVEQANGKARMRGSDGSTVMIDNATPENVAERIKKSRTYYKLMYLAMVEQFKLDNMLVNGDLGDSLQEFLNESKLMYHVAFLKDIYRVFKSLKLKLHHIELWRDGDIWESQSGYVFSDDTNHICMYCYPDCIQFLGTSSDENSEYNVDECDAYEDTIGFERGSYPGFRAGFVKAYKTLRGSNVDTNAYIDRLKALGVGDDALSEYKQFFLCKNNSKLTLQRCYRVITWCYKYCTVTDVKCFDFQTHIWFKFEDSEYSVFVMDSVDSDAEYVLDYETPDGTVSKTYAYQDGEAFKRSLRDVKKYDALEESLMPNDKYCFFIGDGYFGFSSRLDNLIIHTDSTLPDNECEGMGYISDVFGSLYQGKGIRCYGADSDEYLGLMGKSKYLERDAFILKMYGALDGIMSRAGYNVSADIPRILVGLDYKHPKFEFVERNNVTGQVKGYVYCPIFDVKIPFSCSSSTWTAIEVWVGQIPGRVVGDKFSKLHYHQLQLRAGNYLNMFDFKRLRLEFLKENERVFGGVLDKFFAVCVNNYNQRFTSDDSDYSAVYKGYLKCIFVNATNHQLQDLRHGLLYSTRCTLLHEMCHYYTDYRWGTVVENPGEDGATIYGLDQKYGIQLKYHGKHFGEAIQMVSDVTGIPFNDLFSYNIGPVSKEKEKAWAVGSDCNVKTVAALRALDNGKSYRSYAAQARELYMCGTCGQVFDIQAVCHGKQTTHIGFGRFVTRCRQCGDIHVYEGVIDLPVDIQRGYYSAIDLVGLLSVMPCQKCGGSVTAMAPGLSKQDSQDYFKDFRFTLRYRDHFSDIASGTLEKYNKWFRRVAGCEVSIDKEPMPCVSFKILGDSFEEFYKLFFASGKGTAITGSLYRDYGGNAKGYLIHKFRLRTDTDIIKFMDYFMQYVRKDFKTT